MIEEIKDGFENLKDTLGEKPFIILLIAGIGFGLYNLVKGENSEEDSLQVANAYASYPDVDTNANVIMDSINNTIDSSTNDINNAIDSSTNEIIGIIESSTSEIIETDTETKNEIVESLNEHDNKVADYVNEGITKTEVVYNYMGGNYYDELAEIKNKVDDLSKDTKSALEELKKATPTKKTPVTSKKVVNKSSANYVPSVYRYINKEGLNTNTSIVDSLKAIGVDSSMSNRKKIANANGIANYTGTYEQNVTMLNKLKNGELKKVW